MLAAPSDLSRIPEPPAGLHVHPGLQAAFTLIQLVPITAALLFGVRWWRVRHSTIPLLCLAGGALTMLLEPIIDICWLAFFPRSGQWIGFEAFGRPMPVWLCLAYVWFFGGQAFLAWAWLRHDPRPAQVWRIWAVFLATDVVLEAAGLTCGLYLYYGRQPFAVGGLPLLAPLVNASVPVIAAAVLLKIEPELRGPWALPAVLVVPFADALGNLGPGLPTFTVLNTRLPVGVGFVAAAGSAALVVMLLRQAGRLLLWAPTPSARV
ncbi:MAG TPA: hypothetical protein VHL53_19215 [Acidimicrobiia bacterium]|nr:hypothetical protein [Acidimicrobiia bacterium]